MRTKLFTVLAVVVMAFLLATNPMVGNAAGMITGKQIKNGSITGKDIKDGSVSAKDVSGSIAGPTGATGPQGPAGPQGAVRAWARVNYNAIVTRSVGGVSVAHPEDGVYCVTAPGIVNTATAPVVSVDYDGDDTSSGTNQEQSFAEIDTADFLVCPASATAEVNTYTRSYTGGSTSLDYTDNAFTILIP